MKTLVFTTVLTCLITACSLLEGENYRASFSNNSLRRKFSLSGNGFNWSQKGQKRYERAKERDYRILLRKMNKNN